MTADDASDLAWRCAASMWDADQASQALGMTLDHVAPGLARLSMTVTRAMLNGHGACHGGYIFTLADSAFAFACNTTGERVVAQAANITFLRPARLGERLVAEAVERAGAGRSGIFDVRVVGEDGQVVSEFRGQSRVTAASS